MSVSELQSWLGWCLVINLAVLIWWASWFLLARDWIYRLHGRWFNLSEQQFDAIHYGGMAFYKLLILVFNLAPWLALGLMGD